MELIKELGRRIQKARKEKGLTQQEAANDMRQLYLSCPPAARKVLLNSTRALTDELKEMVQTAGVDPDEHLENK